MRWRCHPHAALTQPLQYASGVGTTQHARRGLLVLALAAWGGAAALRGGSELDVSADFDEPIGASRGAAADDAGVPVLTEQVRAA